LNVQQSVRESRQGFTLIELVVVVCFWLILFGILAIAILAFKETAARFACANNLRQLALACHNHEVSYGYLPCAGAGTGYSADSLIGTPGRQSTTDLPGPGYPSNAGSSGIQGLGANVYQIQSVFTSIMPFLDPAYTSAHTGYNTDLPYNYPAPYQTDTTFGQKSFPFFLCPSNATRPASGLDNEGYGYSDYGATVYTDIDPNSGLRAVGGVTVPAEIPGGSAAYLTTGGFRADGALASSNLAPVPASSLYLIKSQEAPAGTPIPGFLQPAILAPSSVGLPSGQIYKQPGYDQGPPIFAITDGASFTMMLTEDSRSEALTGPYPDPGTFPQTSPLTDRFFWRWAEPGNAIGVSGDPLYSSTTGAYNGIPVPLNIAAPTSGRSFVGINNNRSPLGGPATCPWATSKSNCGPNGQIFSYHPAGANASFVDGHVAFITNNVQFQVLRALVTRAGGD
jgi:prepilin-type processing-associated H-X9-DG protein